MKIMRKEKEQRNEKHVKGNAYSKITKSFIKKKKKKKKTPTVVAASDKLIGHSSESKVGHSTG